MLRFVVMPVAALCMLASSGPTAHAADFLDRYGQWSDLKTDPQGKKYHQCKYNYKTKTGDDAVQYVVYYPNDAQRKNYYYWTKDGSNYWGRCIRPGAPNYNDTKMQWYKYDTTGQGISTVTITITLTLGDCPAPGDADSDDGIVKVPPPPGS
jgi:hypothetical protein